MPKKSASERLAECRLAGRTCEVSGCGIPADRWGRLCKRHNKREEQTGHPGGRTIRVKEIEPFIKTARRYIRANQAHPAIEKALRFLYGLINDTRLPVGEHLPRNPTPEDRMARWLQKMRDQGVHEVDALALIVAVYCHREWSPRDFKSDRHFRHQLVTRLLRMVRAPRVELWGAGKPIYRYDRVTVSVRELLGRQMAYHLDFLCNQLSRMLCQRLRQNP